MTDPDLTPEQDAVRRLLAQARHDEPTPDPVVARLEATLAELTADRRAAPVVDLSARRRRRAGAALLAAAAVVVAGVAIGQGLPGGTEQADNASAGDATTSQESGDRTFSDDGGQAEPEASVDARSQGAAEAPGVAPYAAALTDGPGLRADLRDLQRDEATDGTQSLADTDALVPAEDASCLTTDLGAGRAAWVTFDGDPAGVVFRAPAGGRQRVEVWLCGATGPKRTLTLPAR